MPQRRMRTPLPAPDVYHAIVDPTRRRLIDLLRAGEQPVNRLAEAFDVSRPAISQHLRVLKQSGLVSERRVGRERRYRLQAAALREVAAWVRRYEKFWHERLHKLGEYLHEEARHEKH